MRTVPSRAGSRHSSSRLSSWAPIRVAILWRTMTTSISGRGIYAELLSGIGSSAPTWCWNRRTHLDSVQQLRRYKSDNVFHYIWYQIYIRSLRCIKPCVVVYVEKCVRIDFMGKIMARRDNTNSDCICHSHCSLSVSPVLSVLWVHVKRVVVAARTVARGRLRRTRGRSGRVRDNGVVVGIVQPLLE